MGTFDVHAIIYKTQTLTRNFLRNSNGIIYGEAKKKAASATRTARPHRKALRWFRGQIICDAYAYKIHNERQENGVKKGNERAAAVEESLSRNA